MCSVTATRSLLAGKTVDGPLSARIKIDDREYINFVGTGYLALSGITEIRDAVAAVLAQGAPFAKQLPAAVGACDPIFDAVERAGAKACGKEASVYFASGYFIGPIGLKSLDTPYDLILLDETAHYNLKDAVRLLDHPNHTYAHCSVESLREVLKKYARPKQRPLLVTDGVFATTGRVPPLREYAKELEQYDGRLFVDESHAFGVVGDNGRGAAEFCGVEYLAAMGATLSKALCAQGAFVACSAAAADRLRAQTPVRGACAGSPLSAAAAAASLTYVSEHPQVRRDVRAMAEYLRLKLRSIGLDVIDSPAPIVSFRWGRHADMQALQRRLFDRDIHIHHSTYIDAGPEGMIRCAVFRDHSKEDVDRLTAALAS